MPKRCCSEGIPITQYEHLADQERLSGHGFRFHRRHAWQGNVEQIPTLVHCDNSILNPDANNEEIDGNIEKMRLPIDTACGDLGFHTGTIEWKECNLDRIFISAPRKCSKVLRGPESANLICEDTAWCGSPTPLVRSPRFPSSRTDLSFNYLLTLPLPTAIESTESV